jgi:type IV secretory pathway VirJ component
MRPRCSVSSRAVHGSARVALLTVAALLLAGCSRHREMRDEGRLGRVELFRPDAEGGAPENLVFLFSGMEGDSAALRRAGRELARAGTLAVSVDLPSYLHGLSASDDGCHYVIAELEDLAHRLERELGFAGYRSPILAGIGAGGTLAYAALAQSPAATVSGAVAVDPTPSLHTRVALCEGAAASSARGGGFSYAPASNLPGRLRIVTSTAPSPALAAIVAASPRAERVDAVAGDAGAKLVEALDPLLGGEDVEGEVAGALPDLPLIDIPARDAKRLFAVIWSGDGGWRDIDKTIGELFAKRGIPVVGVDCLRYFWQQRDPAQMAADLSRILTEARKAWNTPDALLIGYSFGADVLPFAVNRLPAEDRSHVVLLSLLGLEPHAPFEIEVSGWLGSTDEDAPLVLPELLQFDLSRLQCVYGEEEEDSLCAAPELARAEILRFPGGHHFDENYEQVADAILASAQRRLRPRAISRRCPTRRPRSARRRLPARPPARSRPARRDSAAPTPDQTCP